MKKQTAEDDLCSLWELATSKGYNLHLNSNNIDLVPRSHQGESHSVTWSREGLKNARAWLEKIKPIRRKTTDHDQSNDLPAGD